MFKQATYSICMLIASVQYHNLTAVEPQEHVKCYTVADYKKTLLSHIANQNWRAVFQTQANMQQFLNDNGNKSVQAFTDYNRHLFSAAAYGAVTLFAALFVRRGAPKLATSAFFGALTTHSTVKASTVTSENVYNKEQRWLTKTIKPVEPMIAEYLHQNTEHGHRLTTRHG